MGISGKSNSDGVYADTGLKVNYTFGGPKGFLVPYASAKYLYTSLGHSQETGANLLNLHYSATNTSLGELAVGTTAGIDFQKKYGTLVPLMQLGAIASVGNTRIANTETLSGLSGEETAIATPSGGLTAGVGIDMIGRGPWKLSAAWKGQYGGNTSIENLTLEGRYIW